MQIFKPIVYSSIFILIDDVNKIHIIKNRAYTTQAKLLNKVKEITNAMAQLTA